MCVFASGGGARGRGGGDQTLSPGGERRDWSVVRIYLRFLRPIGPSRENIPAIPPTDWSVVREYTRTSSNRLVRPGCRNGVTEKRATDLTNAPVIRLSRRWPGVADGCPHGRSWRGRS
eukprot:3204525-Pyramimonas_sp.AAC.1